MNFGHYLFVDTCISTVHGEIVFGSYCQIALLLS